MKKIVCACLLLLPLSILAQGKIRATPAQVFGQLFVDVQVQHIFPDEKTFVDCIPKRKPADIMYDYGMMKGEGFNLKKFVDDNFALPVTPAINYIQPEKELAKHIRNLWGVLQRAADTPAGEKGSLLSLSHPYIVPGGGLRELQYWDSYFIMLGLKESGEVAMIEDMIDNFASLINEYGHVPAGGRTYYISRTQPPFFCLMVNLLVGTKGKAVYKKYLPAMLKEYAYWMEGSSALKNGEAAKRVVKLADGSLLNRYWSEEATPREEHYTLDIATAEEAAQQLAMLIRVSTPEKLKEILDNRRAAVYRELRSAGCSGWDGSSRWLKNPDQLWSIQTTQIVPIDLNSLLYSMEHIIATAALAGSNEKLSKSFALLATKRKTAMLKYCWNQQQQFFFDYNFETNQPTEVSSAAGLFPLFVKIVSVAQAAGMAKTLSSTLLKAGGVGTTNNRTGLHWDAPNGWAPIQWVAVAGLRNYQNHRLARLIAQRWLAVNETVYAQTGRIMEKYNVEDITSNAGGGEYKLQDGYGWTNGVYMALKTYLSRKK